MATSQDSPSDRSSRRATFQFKIRTLLVLFVVVGCMFSWIAANRHQALKRTYLAIKKLYDPESHVFSEGGPTPGGETLVFSDPMIELISIGDFARVHLHDLIEDDRIQNEVVVVLGAMGDESTVPLLIAAYPDPPSGRLDSKRASLDDPEVLKIVCFTHALTYLTCEPIGRSRLGSDLNPMNKQLWEDWWRRHKATFKVSAKPLATWVPGYP